MKAELIFAATQIIAAQCTGSRGQGMHKSPSLVSDAVDLAEQLLAEISKRDSQKLASQKLAIAPLPEPIGAGDTAPKA